ncbi:germination-specific N-acetylmuramoyl-L-alanine amidase [Alicyclobacillus cellulosilyticus]|uniref:Germination-specific N-acetylmuramoyl-L-alanine amidase n=1 Tax=Alicyclobacillus cellulosilyticus TaxID=1003997 RepID=A0A917K4K8_9BACL|nr:germination-specific N-acetylmuramoyl-L-alanine amidase [Alicyclobacillus cellulosilyticus]
MVGRRIVIDAGHGGPDSGAQGAWGLLEKDINLAVAQKTAILLRQLGAVVCMTRETDTDLSAPEERIRGRRHRTDLAGRLLKTLDCRPDAFVSIHCNAVPDPRWRGAHVIHLANHGPGKTLADVMQAEFRAHLLPTSRQVDETTTLYLLKRLRCPAVLAEIGFLTNPDEAAHLATPAYQWRVAECIAVSLLRFFALPDAAGAVVSGAEPRGAAARFRRPAERA